MDEEDFNRLLEWLDPEREAACAKYSIIYRNIVKFFACRGCHEAEDCADETFNRVTARVRELREREVNPPLYFYGVAKNVFREWLRKSRRARPAPPPPPERDDLALDCLDKCLAELAGESRETVVGYYRGEGRARIRSRESLARALGITLNALRVRACNLRAALRDCVAECVRRGAGV
jgi:DNA-directed RNA polymerase specialized sigma24 family protein